jgi:hypothetical protein
VCVETGLVPKQCAVAAVGGNVGVARPSCTILGEEEAEAEEEGLAASEGGEESVQTVHVTVHDRIGRTT